MPVCRAEYQLLRPKLTNSLTNDLACLCVGELAYDTLRVVGGEFTPSYLNNLVAPIVLFDWVNAGDAQSVGQITEGCRWHEMELVIHADRNLYFACKTLSWGQALN